MRSKKKSLLPKARLVVIVGPTASGKSALAIAMAKRFNGEIISADSRQIYRGLAIGSGAVSKKETSGTRHWLIGIASPKRAFTAAQFKSRAERAIKDITQRGKLPFLVGGTAFWIDALAYGFNIPEVAPDRALRKRLERKNAPMLFAMLKKLDPKRANTIEQKNPRRLIRAIEIAKALGRVPKLKKSAPYRTLWLGLNPSATTLKRRVNKRAEAMIRHGLAAETRRLLKAGIGPKRIREFGFEYRAALDYLRGAKTQKEFLERLARDTLAYTRRQKTWWRRNQDIRWIKNQKEARELVKIFLKKTS